MHRSAFVRLSRAAALGLVLGGSGSVAAATPAAWDQAEVRAIAGQLAGSVEDVRYDVRQAPRAMLGSPTWRRDGVEDGKKARVPSSTLEKVEAARVYFDQLAPDYEDPAPAAEAAPTP